MSGQFKIGEILVGQYFFFDVELNGMECVVRGGLADYTGIHRHLGIYRTAPGYQVAFSNGRHVTVAPYNLRRKQPPVGEQSVLDMFKLPAPNQKEPA